MLQVLQSLKKILSFKTPIDMSVCKPTSWAVKSYDRSENEKNIEKKRGKGVPQQIIKNELQYDDFKIRLTFGDIIKYNDFHTIRSINHKLHTFHRNKISFNSYDTKMYILNDGMSSLAYGHYKIKQMNE